MNLPLITLVINAVSTWFMTGVIWFVQIVHYPLFSEVGSAQFQQYAEHHRQLTSLVVAGPMLIELFTALLLVVLWKGPDRVLIWVALALLLGIWVCTICFSIPCHEKFCSEGFVANAHRWLVCTNWLRTVLWTIRGGLLAWVIFKSLVSKT